MRRLAIALALLALLVVPASQARAQAPAGGNGYGASVSAIDNVFTPEIVRIQPGETVEWTIDGRSPHTVQADDGSWDSGHLEPGAMFTHTFGKPVCTHSSAATTGSRVPGWRARQSSATHRSRAAACRDPIPAQLRLMLTAGGVAAYLVFLPLGLVFGG
jgi:plastocyanin